MDSERERKRGAVRDKDKDRKMCRPSNRGEKERAMHTRTKPYKVDRE